MATIAHLQATPPGAGTPVVASKWRATLARLAAAWKARQQALADQRIDRYFSRARGEHERFLSHAADHYELERLERSWERRHTDVWRM